jgi:hypothetical protein
MTDDDTPRMARLAGRVGVSEGQLYTLILAVLAVALLLVTALPGAGERPAPSTGAPIVQPAERP